MKKISILFLFLILFVLGCSKEEVVLEPKITAQVVESDEDFYEEDPTEELTENLSTVRLCHDTDNGIIKWINGTIFGYYNNAKRFEFNDYCFDNQILIEYYCEDENPNNRSFVCENGCEDNHCL